MTHDDRRAPRFWVVLLGVAGVAVVILSWMAPESEPARPNPAPRYASISYSQCAPQDVAPPNYGTRSVSSTSLDSTGCIR